MHIVKSPFRVCFFGGSTDYKDFYSEHGSFLIGTTINKYAYLMARETPSILPQETTISYSKLEIIKNLDKIENPLIRETLRYYDIKKHIDFKSYTDIPFRTGLGGSSSFCVGLSYLINLLNKKNISKRQLVMDAINIERNILKESGGIQDQIWAAYGGLNSINIDKHGKFSVRPLPVTSEFEKEFQSSIILIYSNQQRNQDTVAKSHEKVDKHNILAASFEAYKYFLGEDIPNIGKLLYASWLEKRKISNLISNGMIDDIIDDVIHMGAYGAKLLGAGGCGFVCVVADPLVRSRIEQKYKKDILDIRFEKDGVSEIYSTV